MPESERSDEGISSCEEPSELLIVTRLVTGTLSFSHMISGCGEACQKKNRGIRDQLQFSQLKQFSLEEKKKRKFTSKFIVILTEFPAFTTMKLFILRLVNFGLTETEKNGP